MRLRTVRGFGECLSALCCDHATFVSFSLEAVDLIFSSTVTCCLSVMIRCAASAFAMRSLPCHIMSVLCFDDSSLPLLFTLFFRCYQAWSKRALSPSLEQIAEDLHLRLDHSGVTVSGISSGGYFANQLHVAFSSVVRGAAIFAGGPYLCAMGSVLVATTTCMAPLTDKQAPKASEYKLLAEDAAAMGLIDPLANLHDDNVFLYSGTLDSVVYGSVVRAGEDFYRYFVSEKSIVTEYSIPSEHTQPTLDYGNRCSKLGEPYISKCDYDGAQHALTQLYGSLKPSTTMVEKNFLKFDQTPYYSGSLTSLNTYGYIYVPTACQGGATCKLHISFHGCLQGAQSIGDQYAHDSGYNEWAETNNIVVLYPYAKPDSLLGNPNGCWDWWGYTNVEYAYKNGVQMKFAKNLIDALFGTSLL